jgi:hypothetical protein
MKIRNLTLMTLITLLAVIGLACGGGGSDPVNPTPQDNGGGGVKLTGRILDREGTPAGTPYATVKLTVAGGGDIAPSLQPANSGPTAGVFEFVGLPTGVPLTLEIDLFQVAIGRNLGWIQQVNLSGSGTFDLGDITLENEFLDNGWNLYTSKDYTFAIINFKRAITERYIQADLTASSSAYTGLGWTYAKRGKDNQTGLYWVDNLGNWLDTINSYEWDQAILNFDRAIANQNDADAWAGMGGTYLTLLGQASKDPIVVGTGTPIYGFVHFYFDEAQNALNRALQADPNLNLHHDQVTADDLQATLIFLRWIGSQPVTLEEVTSLAATGDLNQGSQQLLAVMPDLIQYNPYPQK